jgi:hypothetical protein
LNKQRLIVQLLIVRLILKHDTSYDIFFAWCILMILLSLYKKASFNVVPIVECFWNLLLQDMLWVKLVGPSCSYSGTWKNK